MPRSKPLLRSFQRIPIPSTRSLHIHRNQSPRLISSSTRLHTYQFTRQQSPTNSTPSCLQPPRTRSISTSRPHHHQQPSQPQPQAQPEPQAQPQQPQENTYYNPSTASTPPGSQPTHPSHRSFYKTHSRAFFKSFTLAFLTYQIIYWFWLTIGSEEEKDAMEGEIRGLEGAVRVLEEGRGHFGREGDGVHEDGKDEGGGRRLLEEKRGGG